MVRVLQLVTTRRPFFEQQVDVLESAGIECDVVGVPKPPSGPRSLRHYVRFYGRVLRQLSDGPYALVHANFGLTAPFALAQPYRPLVLSLWGTDVYGKYGHVGRWCAGRADATVVMSEGMADRVDVDCHVVPHGVDLTSFAPRPRAAARRAVGWARNGKYVLFPWDPSRHEKDHPRAERIVEAVDDALPVDVSLKAVHGVDHGTMPAYMNAADALLVTSKWEGSPNSVREALACNLPVVSTDVGDVAEMLDDVSLSAVARSDDALVTELARVLTAGEGSDGREHVRHLGLDRMADRLLAVYEDALGRSLPVGDEQEAADPLVRE